MIQPFSSRLDENAVSGATHTGVAVDFFVPDATGEMEAHPAPRTPPVTQALDRFAEMTETPVETPPLQAPQPSQSLDQVFGKDLFAQSPKAAQTETPTDAHVDIDGHSRRSMNDLWKAIAPCWHRLASTQSVGVRLSVSFSGLGNLSKPPVIVRAAGMPLNERQLKSESLAIAALSQCGPYPMVFGQNDVTVDFPAGG